MRNDVVVPQDDRWWMATAIRAGTNERMCETAETREQVEIKLYGQAYGPKYGSVVLYRIEKPDG